MQRNKKALIIGAGSAGLTAAYKLLTETDDIQPIIFEESDNVGGIARTVWFDGNGIDIGGHRLFTKNKEILELWESFLPQKRNPEVEDEVMLKRQRFSEILYLRKFFDYPLKMTKKTFENIGLKQAVIAGFSYLKSCIFKRKELNLEDFMVNRFGEVLYKMFFEKYTEKVWGRHPKYISKDWGEQRIKGLSLMRAVISALKLSKTQETSLISEFYYPKFGCGQLWNIMAEKIIALGGEIHYSTSVVGLSNVNNKVHSIKIMSDGQVREVFGDYIFSSMPVKDLLNSMMDVPKQVLKISNGLSYRDYMLVGLYLEDINLKENDKLTKDCWIYIQEEDIMAGRIQILNNWSPYIVKDNNKVFISIEYFCQEGDRFWQMSDEKFINFAINEMKKLKIVDEKQVISSTRIKLKKAYPTYFDTYKDFYTVKEYLSKFDNLYCIGRNGQHRYNNIDHSMLTAIEAVKVIRGLSKINKVWSVNSEQSYNETK